MAQTSATNIPYRLTIRDVANKLRAGKCTGPRSLQLFFCTGSLLAGVCACLEKGPHQRTGPVEDHRMELRRDPITQSWVVLGHREVSGESAADCPFEPAVVDKQRAILTWPAEGPWQIRVLPHPEPLYRIEGEMGRLADGMYDKMGPVGAHEVVVETPQHDKRLSQLSDEVIERVLWVWASRIADLKKDTRFKYVAVFKNQGTLAGEEWPHAHSEVAATIFVPRRVKYELHAASEWYGERERCVFCDIVRQEEKQGKRIVDVQGDYYALCPYASRVPYETWLLHRRHNHVFEQPRPGSNRRQLAVLLARVLRRFEKFSPAFHLVVHTAPNTRSRKGELAGYWKTLADDFHWHIEILPIVESRSKSYSIKEVYFNAVLPEDAAAYLRSLDPNA
jgi:UDPglucose--hexose-1-phosphate uridylyltransferase